RRRDLCRGAGAARRRPLRRDPARGDSARTARADRLRCRADGGGRQPTGGRNPVTNRKWTRGLAALLAVALAIAFAASGSSSDNTSTSPSTATSSAADQPGKGKPAVTIGDKNFTEQYILGELYAQALRAKGYTVNVKSNIGSSEIIDKALTSGKLDMYPEYTGVILSELAHQKQRPADPDEAYADAQKFQEGRGYTLLDKTPFFDSDALAVKPDFATKNNLETVADLKKLGKNLKLGAPPEFKTRYEG